MVQLEADVATCVPAGLWA